LGGKQWRRWLVLAGVLGGGTVLVGQLFLTPKPLGKKISIEKHFFVFSKLGEEKNPPPTRRAPPSCKVVRTPANPI